MPKHKPSETVILLADDDLVVRNLIGLMLSKQKYGVLTAVNGKEALDLLEKAHSPVNLLLTDVLMPVMDGLTLARIVREQHPEIKIVVMSGQMDQQIREGNALDAFLSKPFVPAVLLETIQKVIDKEPGEPVQV